MKYAFHHLALQAPSLYALIGTWAELRLTVTDTTALITGYGYAPGIAAAFTALVLDWEATIALDRDRLELDNGAYDLFRSEEDDTAFACRKQQSFPLPDQAVWVEVVSG